MLTAGPFVAIGAPRTLSGTPTTSAEVDGHRSMILSGTTATLVTGIAMQRTLNHRRLAPRSSRSAASWARGLSIGATTSAIVIGDRHRLGESGHGKLDHPATALVFGG